MIDKKEFHRRVLWRILGHPITTWSGVASVALATLAIFMNDPAIPVFFSIGALVVSMGTAGYNALYRADVLAKETIQSIQQEEEKKLESRLEDLFNRLKADGDPRDDRALQDLRALVHAFREDESILAELDPTTVTDIFSGVDRLFGECIDKLERSLANLNLIKRLSAQAAAPLVKQREEVIAEVQNAVRELGNIFAGAQKLAVARRAGAGSAESIRVHTSELAQALELAQRVEERMRGMQNPERQYEEYLKV